MKGYHLDERIDLVKNRRQLRTVTLLSVVLLLLCLGVGVLITPLSISEPIILKLLTTSVGCFLYIIGHEAVHGVLMWYFSRVRPNFGFSLMYAYAGSDFFFPKTAYLIIALAPLILWTILLSLLAWLVPSGWFWPVWIVQITNVSGAAGDLFVFFRILRKPDAVRVQDTGTSMSVWLPG